MTERENESGRQRETKRKVKVKGSVGYSEKGEGVNVVGFRIICGCSGVANGEVVCKNSILIDLI